MRCLPSFIKEIGMEINGAILLDVYNRMYHEFGPGDGDDKSHFTKAFNKWVESVRKSLNDDNLDEFNSLTRLNNSYGGKKTKALLKALGINRVPRNKYLLREMIWDKMIPIVTKDYVRNNPDNFFMRRCSKTLEGMNKGNIFGDGDRYFKYERDALEYAKSIGYKDLAEAYKDEAQYYTEWEELDLCENILYSSTGTQYKVVGE